MRKIRKIEPLIPIAMVKKKVAAYARVSSGKDEMLHSLSAQVSYYSSYIQRHSNWEYVGVYADEATTGTKSNRAEFNRLINDAREGKIDLIITKSISRFARNTVDMLEAVRELKGLNVDVYFEKENIHSMSGDGELMLTILASFAQEESRSVSENCKWSIRKKFKEGRVNGGQILGYEIVDDNLYIVPEEAKIVHRIFSDYLSGMGKEGIAKKLNGQGITTKLGGKWNGSSIAFILRNEKYTGDMVLQKNLVADHLTKKKSVNNGELPKYYVSQSHELIIDSDTFMKVQEELVRREKRYNPNKKTPTQYPFTSLIRCELCGKNYRRKINNAGTKYEKSIWICSTFNSQGKKACPSKQIPEDILLNETAKVLGLQSFDADIFEKQINEIEVPKDNTLVFVFADGCKVESTWENKPRKTK